MDETLLIEGRDEIFDALIKELNNDRRLIFNCNVDDSNLEDYILHILKWNKEDINIDPEKRKKIYLYINSSGGDVCSGMNFVNAIRASKTPIVGVVFGCASSMASYLLAACTERVAFIDSVILLHDGSTGIMSSSKKAADTMRYYEKCDERLTQVLIDTTNMSREYLEQISDRETYLFADEAKEHGIVDKIIGVDVDIDYILK